MEDNYYPTNKLEEESKESVDIRGFLFMCANNWYWFLLSLTIAFALAVLYILMTPKEFTRQASILIKDDANKTMASDFSQFSDMSFGKDQTNLYNEMITLKSPSYMIDVVRDLNLDTYYTVPGKFHVKDIYGKTLPVRVKLLDVDEKSFAKMVIELKEQNEYIMHSFEKDGEELGDGKVLKAKFGAIVQSPLGKVLVTPTDAYDGVFTKPITVERYITNDVAKRYANSLQVELNNDRASVIDMRIDDVSPERAEDILYTLFDVYNKKWVEDINKQAISTSKFIDEELRMIENELGNVDEDISSYKSENLVPNVDLASNIYLHKADATSSQLLELNNQLYMANYIKKQLLSDGQKFKVLPANSGIENNSVSQQIYTYNEKVLQRNALIANSGVNNPLIIELDQSLMATRQAIVASLDNVIATLNSRMKDLRGSESQTKSQIASNPTQAKYLLSVERQQKVKEQLYLFLLQKREENQLSKAFTAYNTKLLNLPDGSRRATKPVKFNILLIATVLGLFIPLFLLFIIKTMDTTIHNRKDLEGISLPFIGEIPLSYKKHKGIMAFLNKRHETREIVVKEKSGNAINEAFRVVRTNLEFVAGKEGVCHTIMFTSANAGSGKTFISMNLSASFAIKGKRVLVVDMDFRKGSLSTFVNSPSKGIVDYLSEHVENIDDVILKDTITKNLHVLPAGTRPPNPTELLFTDRLSLLLEELKKRYDYIFFDCPPLEIVADASIINKLTEMTVYVIRSGLYDRRMLLDLERSYNEKRYKNMNIILNGTTDEGNGYGYHRYGYGYGYGYGYVSNH